MVRERVYAAPRKAQHGTAQNSTAWQLGWRLGWEVVVGDSVGSVRPRHGVLRDGDDDDGDAHLHYTVWCGAVVGSLGWDLAGAVVPPGGRLGILTQLAGLPAGGRVGGRGASTEYVCMYSVR